MTAYYGGSRVFRDLEISESIPVIVGDASGYRLSLFAGENHTGSSVTKFIYGQKIYPVLEEIKKDGDKVTIEPVQSTISYTLTVDSGGEIGFIPGESVHSVGGYNLQALLGGEICASCDFEVLKRPVTIIVENKTNVSAEEVESNLPRIYSEDMDDGELEALELEYIVFNSSGNVVTMENGMEPGNYTVYATPPTTIGVGNSNYFNYSITFMPGTYTVIGATFKLEANAANYTDPSGTRPVGTVGISNASQNFAYYTPGTVVLLYATPQAGFEVDKWTAIYADNTEKTQMGDNTFRLTTEAQEVVVTVTFKPATITLNALTQPEGGGAITCSDEYFSPGASVSYGAEYVFTAFPADGYHFGRWQVVSGGTTTTHSGTSGVDGSNHIVISVGAKSMTVYAVFDRDSYILNLEGNITASYMYDHDNDPTTAPEKRIIESGSPVTGDTQITVEPKTGYQAAEDAFFMVNGELTEEKVSYIFTMTDHTTVSLDTVRNKYGIETEAENGSVSVTVNGSHATETDLEAVEGGSEIVFAARADRGYVFDHWKLNDEIVEGNKTQRLTVSELGGNIVVEAVFVPNTEYRVTAAVNDTSRGTMAYTLYDIYGDFVGEEKTEMPSEGLTVYKENLSPHCGGQVRKHGGAVGSE